LRILDDRGYFLADEIRSGVVGGFVDEQIDEGAEKSKSAGLPVFVEPAPAFGGRNRQSAKIRFRK